MKKNITYGKCLSDILHALDLKSSKLARGINIDSSLIYKWLRNERVPSVESPYIELILKFIEGRLKNSAQRNALAEVLFDYGIDLSEINDSNILNHLRFILKESQGYSIRLHNKIKSRNKLFTNGISTAAEPMENMKTGDLFCGRDQVQIIKGTLKVLYATLHLLKQLPETPHPGSDTILITLNSDMRLLFETGDLNSVCLQTLSDLLRKGWNIIFKVMLDSNVSRTIKIAEYIQSLLAAGNLSIYYIESPSGPSQGEELCIAPQVGALHSFSSNAANQIDNAFLFRSKTCIEMLTGRFFYCLSSARPLLKSYPAQESSEFQRVFAESEEMLGDKYVLKEGLSTVTIPLGLFEKYLISSDKSNQEISHRMFLHQRRLDAFNTQVKHFKFKDICFIESLERLVDKREYSPDENYILKDATPGNEDIVLHLEHLIDLLKKYDNYSIAFVDRTQFLDMTSVNWMVKGKDRVLMEAFKDHPPNDASFCREMNFVITEKGVVNAFHDYFLILWDKIPAKSKDKKNTIPWLKSLIEKCNSNESS